MNFLIKIKNHLNQKVKLCNISSLINSLVKVFLIITFFFLFFQPFGKEFSFDVKSIVLRLIAISMITMIFFIVYSGFLFLQYKLQNSFRRYHFYSLIFIALLLSAIFINGFESFTEDGTWNIQFKEVLEKMVKISLVSILPLTFFYVKNKITDLKQKNTIVKLDKEYFKNKVADGDQSVILKSKNEREVLNLKIDDIYFISALQNYVTVKYYKDEKFQTTILRNTIQNIDDQLKNTSIVRCHRSYLVNLSKVYAINKANQKLYLKMLKQDEEVIVSRSYVKEFRDKFDEFTELNYKVVFDGLGS